MNPENISRGWSLTVLYVVSAEEAAGKTAICAGLGKYLQNKGINVGFLELCVNDNAPDGDAVFMKQTLNLTDSAESLCLGADNLEKIKEAYSEVGPTRDVVIVEGMLGRRTEDKLTQASCAVARAVNARVMVVEAYSGQIASFIDVYKEFGTNLLGVILNKVPVSQLKRTQDEASKKYSAAGIKVLGVIPEDRALLALTVGELADGIQGKILTNNEKSTELVENLMLGAMVVDSAVDYFGRKTRKAAVIRQDRPDLQLAALATSTACLVLSGSNKTPVKSVLERAKTRGIPIIVTEAAVGSLVANIEGAIRESRFHQEKKLLILNDLLKQHLDLQAVSIFI